MTDDQSPPWLKDFSPLSQFKVIHTPEKYYEVIGKISANFSTLEFMMPLMIEPFLKCDASRTQIVTAGMSIFQITTLAKHFGGTFLMKEDSKALNILLNKIDKIAEERNAVVHSFWRFKDGVATKLRVSRSTRKFESQNITLTYLKDLDLRISNVILDLIDMGEKIEIKIKITEALAKRSIIEKKEGA